MTIGAKNLTEGNIFKQLTTLAFPVMAISFVQMAYSLINVAWVGRLGSDSSAAVGSMGFLIWLASSFALISKVGAEISIGQSVGAKKFKRAKEYASHTTTIALITGVIAALILFLGAEYIVPFFKLQNDIAQKSINYLRVVSTALPFAFLSFTFAGIYNGIGRSNKPFYFMAAGLALNIILDPLLIFGIGSFNGYGTQGAAYATWISQLLVMLIFIYNLKGKNAILDKFTFFIKPKGVYVGKILKLGFPVAIMTFLFASINIYLIRIASIYGGYIGVMSQTVGGQIEGITWNTTQGFSTALGAFAAQNYAIRKFGRMRKAYQYTLSMLLSLGVLVTAAFMLFGEQIFGIFIPEVKAMLAGGNYLFIVGISQIFMMLELTTQGMFNGTGKTLPPAIISIGCNIMRIPLALFLASRIGINGVWWAITITSVAKGTLLPIWFSIVSRRIERKKEENPILS